MNIFPQSDESIRDELLRYLSEKYGREFTALALERGYSDYLHCYLKGGDPKADNVGVQRITRDTGVEYKDTYFGIVIREELENEVVSICSDIDLPMQAQYDSISQFFNNIFDSTKNYDDFKRWVENGNPWRFTVTIVIALDDTDKAEAYANHIFEQLSEAGFSGLVHVCSLPSEGYAKLTRINLNDLITQYDDQETLFSESIN